MLIGQRLNKGAFPDNLFSGRCRPDPPGVDPRPDLRGDPGRLQHGREPLRGGGHRQARPSQDLAQLLPRLARLHRLPHGRVRAPPGRVLHAQRVLGIGGVMLQSVKLYYEVKDKPI